ncbi:MAG: hypothetical protein Q4A07_03230 [Coriobacteriales bacterium]|nr:hypothetical protein [Coriobacteriales bacterium]
MTLLLTVLVTCIACFAVVTILLVLSVLVLVNESQGPIPFPSCRSHGARVLSYGRLLPLPEDMPGAGAEPAPGDDVQAMG